MGGRGDTSKSFNENKVVSNIDAPRNKPFRDKRAKEIEAERSSSSGYSYSVKGDERKGAFEVQATSVFNRKTTIGTIDRSSQKDTPFRATAWNHPDNFSERFQPERSFKTKKEAADWISSSVKSAGNWKGTLGS